MGLLVPGLKLHPWRQVEFQMVYIQSNRQTFFDLSAATLKQERERSVWWRVKMVQVRANLLEEKQQHNFFIQTKPFTLSTLPYDPSFSPPRMPLS